MQEIYYLQYKNIAFAIQKKKGRRDGYIFKKHRPGCNKENR